MSGMAMLLRRAGLRLVATGGRYLVYLYLMSFVLVAVPASAQAPWTRAAEPGRCTVQPGRSRDRAHGCCLAPAPEVTSWRRWAHRNFR